MCRDLGRIVDIAAGGSFCMVLNGKFMQILNLIKTCNSHSIFPNFLLFAKSYFNFFEF